MKAREIFAIILPVTVFLMASCATTGYDEAGEEDISPYPSPLDQTIRMQEATSAVTRSLIPF